MTISEFIKVCKKNIIFLIIVPIIFGIVSAVFAWGFMSNEYTSTVPIYILQKSSNGSDISSSDMTTSQQLANDIASMIKTSKVNDAVMEDLGIESLDPYKIKATSNEKNRVINLSVTGKNPDMVADVVNSLANTISYVVVDVMNVDAVKILDSAQPSKDPSGPKRPWIVIIAMLIGLFVATIIVIIKDLADTTIKNKDELESKYDYPVLAQIPYVKSFK